jgi:hypothetical protein
MYRLRLYSPLREWKIEDPPLIPFVHLSVGTYSTGEAGDILLSPQLMTPSEIDDEVDSMKRELEEFRELAKAELLAVNKRFRGGSKK